MILPIIERTTLLVNSALLTLEGKFSEASIFAGNIEKLIVVSYIPN